MLSGWATSPPLKTTHLNVQWKDCCSSFAMHFIFTVLGCQEGNVKNDDDDDKCRRCKNVIGITKCLDLFLQILLKCWSINKVNILNGSTPRNVRQRKYKFRCNLNLGVFYMYQLRWPIKWHWCCYALTLQDSKQTRLYNKLRFKFKFI